MTSTEFSTISILLSLASLLGSVFYIQRSNWLQHLITLKAKYDYAENGQERTISKRAMRFATP